jgi:hypothetical protein
MPRFNNKQELNEFLLSKNIKTIQQLLDSFNLTFSKNEYAIHNIYSNKGESFNLNIWWYALPEGEQKISKEQFIAALKDAVKGLDFSITLEARQKSRLTLVERIEALRESDPKYADHVELKLSMGHRKTAIKYLEVAGF